MLSFRRIFCWLGLIVLLTGCETTAPYVYHYIPGRTATAQLGYAVAPGHAPPAVQQAIEAAERELDGNGRVVVRYSGTEALARVMVEAESEQKMQALTTGIAGEIQKALGV